MIHSKKPITKALIRLRGYAGWSSLVLFQNPRRQVCSRQGPFGNGSFPINIHIELFEAVHAYIVNAKRLLIQNLSYRNLDL